MTIIKTPTREYRLGEAPPALGQKVVSWPWGGTPHLTQWSIDMLRYPLGTIIFDTVDGHPVIAQIQTHDSYGAHPEWGIKLHKGTSVFVPTVIDENTGKVIAMRDPPDGWGVSPMAGWPHIDRYIGKGHEVPLRVSRSASIERWRNEFAASRQKEWLGEYVNRSPKLAVLAGTTLAGGLISGGIGAIVGLIAGIVADHEVRGGPWLPEFSGDFGLGTDIPSQYKKVYQFSDIATGAKMNVQGRDVQEAVRNILVKYYPAAIAVVRVTETNTYQTDKGDTFQVVQG